MTHTDPRAVRSRQAMLEAAVRLLQRGGVDAVTHQSVAAEAGVGRATVYRHWPRPIDLLLDALADAAPVVDAGEGDLRTRLLGEIGPRLPQINSPLTMAVVGVLVGRGDPDGHSDHGDQVHDLRDRIFGQLVAAITGVIAAATQDGQLTAAAPARELAVMILGALLMERTLLGVEVTPEHLEKVVDAALQGWWHTP